MRSIECLVRDYPEKTGTEILEIQRKDIESDKFEYQQRNKRKIEFINDINKNGGYYRGRFGMNQYYYYNITNVVLENSGEIRADVDKIVMFSNNTGHKHISTDKGEIKIEKRLSTYQDLSEYDLTSEERVTLKDWELVVSYLEKMENLFW